MKNIFVFLFLFAVPQILFAQGLDIGIDDFSDEEGMTDDGFGAYPGGGFGGDPGHSKRTSGADALSFLAHRKGGCSFEPNISDDDQLLLQDAQTAVKALRGMQGCESMSSQMDAFEIAMKKFNKDNETDNGANYSGSTPITCSNYKDIFNSEYDFFIATWNEAEDQTPYVSDPMVHL